VVTDAEGLVLSIVGRRRAKSQAAEEMNFVPGARWSEAAAGTNAIGTALAADHALQVFAAEHYSERVQWWTCSAAPIHDPASGEVIGIVDLTARMETVHPHTLALVNAVALTLDTHLRDVQRGHHGARCERYTDARAARAKGQSALLSADGHVLAGEPGRWAAAGAALAAGVGELVQDDGVELEAEALGGG
jgi:transcriptional regulator of acetoin/glycerol metabolism